MLWLLQEWQWALELATHVLRLDSYDDNARRIRSAALKALAAKQTSTNGRNYYLTTLLEDHDVIKLQVQQKAMVYKTPLARLFRVMPSRMRAEDCAERNMTGAFNFTDEHQFYSLRMRNGILETQQEDDDSAQRLRPELDVLVTVSGAVWRSIVAEDVNPLWAYVTGELVVEPNILKLHELFTCVDRAP